MRAAGVNVRAGSLYLAVVDSTADSPSVWRYVDTPTRMTPNNGLDEAHKVADMRNRLRQDLRANDVSAVAVVATRKYNNWKYKDAYDRITLLSVVMFCCAELEIPYQEIKTEDISRVVGVPPHQLGKLEPTQVGYADQPKYWTSGLAEAYGAGATLLRRAEGGKK